MIKSEDIKWQYDEVYYLGGISKHTGRHVACGGAEQFNNGMIDPAKIKSANRVDFKDKIVLDIGFARGELLEYCFDNGARECIGIDYSPIAYKIARSYLPEEIKLYELNVIDIDKIECDKIGVVYLVDLLEHIPINEIETMLDKLKSITTDDCKFVIETPCIKHGGYLDTHNNYMSKKVLDSVLSKYLCNYEIITDYQQERFKNNHTHYVVVGDKNEKV